MRPNNGVVPPRSSCTVVGNVLLLLDHLEFKKRHSFGAFSFANFGGELRVFFNAFCGPAVTMQAQKVVPPDLQCKDKFLVQSVVIGDGLSAKDITSQTVVVRTHFSFWFMAISLVLNL